MSTTIQISKETREELLKIMGQLQAANGKKRTYDEVIRELIRNWRQQRKAAQL